jgi:GTPase SAR1 family protein
MKSDDDAAIVIVGNKSDLINEREVSIEEATLKAQVNHLAFFETSAKENENVHSAFMSLMNQVLKNYKKNNSEDDFNGNGHLKKEKKKNFVNGSNGENIVLDSVIDGFNEEEINLKNNTKCC